MNYTTAITILHIKHGASKEEIKKAFIKLAHIHHPDKGGEAKKFIEVKSAYDFLMINEAPRQNNTNSTGFGYNNRWWNPITEEYEEAPPTTAKTTTRSKAENYESKPSWAENVTQKVMLQQEILNKKIKINNLQKELSNEKFQLAMLEFRLKDFK